MIEETDRMYVRRISYIDIGRYQVEVASKNGNTSGSLCTIVSNEVDILEFDSEKFNKDISLGLIYTPPIASLILHFHRVSAGSY